MGKALVQGHIASSPRVWETNTGIWPSLGLFPEGGNPSPFSLRNTSKSFCQGIIATLGHTALPRSLLVRCQTAEIKAKRKRTLKSKNRLLLLKTMTSSCLYKFSTFATVFLLCFITFQLLCFSDSFSFWKLLLVDLFSDGIYGLWLSPSERRPYRGWALSPLAGNS